MLRWGGSPTAAALAAALCSEGDTWRGALPVGNGNEKTVVLHKNRDRPGIILASLAEDGEAPGETGVDPLTGLPNRAIFLDRLHQSILGASRSKKSVAMLLVGVDRLAIVNDALGFGAGDRLLAELAGRLNQCVRATDAVTRLDGDHFGLALVISSLTDSVLVAEKVFHAVAKPFLIDGRELFITVSIGIGLYPADAGNQGDLIKKSESALRYAKSSGRNQYKFVSNDMNARARHRLELESRLRRALIQKEFLVYYQPKVDVESSMVVGMEALVRWKDPEQGMISPVDFIPIAEETGLIIGIGHFVLAEACRQNVQWLAEGLPHLKVSVNVSVRQLRSRTLVDEIGIVLRTSGLPAEMLELEITESMLVDNVDATLATLRAIRDLGVGLSIDDFGTGYSSLSYLSQLPITTMKIDRAFVSDVESNGKAAEIARAIIGLSKGLKLDVIAEGAETLAHIDFLREHGCALVQGFYYSRPLPPKEFAELVRRGPIVRDA
ncbi:MAG: bifunctional diguanylate cyclase/phosphodiesterase [Alphaproteobacteria bacterium]|nr:bifunctional diguanylate cyclase/phosphodiesterase [Alphaproteobacteria bacterium]